MGGYGSGYQGPKKGTVEDARALDVRDLRRLDVLHPETWRSGSLRWTNGAGEERGSIGYELETHATGGEIRLFYTRQTTPPDAVDFRVSLEAVPQPFGGLRWWFRCPGCSRRVRALYLPSGARTFSCRTCHGLTYESVQTHDARLDALRRNPEALLETLRGGDPSFLAFRAVLKGR